MLFYAAALQTLNYDWDTLHRGEEVGIPVALGPRPGVRRLPFLPLLLYGFPVPLQAACEGFNR